MEDAHPPASTPPGSSPDSSPDNTSPDNSSPDNAAMWEMIGMPPPRMKEGGPPVRPDLIRACLDDLRDGKSQRLPREEAVKVLALVHEYRTWYEALTAR
jgi:hypothetical protein